jgi:hypothetical protein
MARRAAYPGLWWLSPPGAVLLVVPVTLGLAVAFSDSDYRTYFRTPKSLDEQTAVLFAVGAACFVLGALLIQIGRRPARQGGHWPWLVDRQLAVLRRVSTPLYLVTLLGYLSFGVAAVRNGVGAEHVVQALVSQNVSSGEFEQTVGTVPGITTLTQVGIAYAVVASLLLVHGRDRRTLTRLVVIVVLTLLRSYLFTERLALIELLVPVLAVLGLRAAHGADATRRLLLRLAPVPLIVLLIAGFAASEYSRSYNFYKTRTDDTLVQFSLKRLSGYYATAYNNGHLLLTHDRYVGRLPYTTIEAVWTAPGAEQADVYNRLVSRDRGEHYKGILVSYGNLEFNNAGGLAAPFVDYGRRGGLLVLLGLGMLLGLAYRGFVQGQLLSLLLYPVAVTGLLELPRFLYWSLGRTVPAVLALLLTAWLVHRATRRRPRVLA